MNARFIRSIRALLPALAAGAVLADTPRFSVPGDGTVLDHATGLIWLQDTGAFGDRSWEEAKQATESLQTGDFEWLTDGSQAGDWRLPEFHELMTLTGGGVTGGPLPEAHPFKNFPSRPRGVHFWSANPGFYCPRQAWSVHFFRGGDAAFSDRSEAKRVWPVRGTARGIPTHKGKYELAEDFEQLTEQEQVRAERNALWDFKHLRQQNRFVEVATDALLEIPSAIADWYPARYAVANVAPRVWLNVLPDIEPEYFPEGKAYGAGWANWASIARCPDNVFYMAAADHRARGSRMNLYAYPLQADAEGRIERVLDVSDLLGWHAGIYTDGKIHGHLRVMPDGDLWIGTHHGPWPDEDWYAEGYRGSWLFSYNTRTRKAVNWGVPLVGNSLSHFAVDTRHGFLLGGGTLDDTLLCWDINEKRVRFAGHPPNGWKWWHVGLMPDEQTGLFWGADISEEPYRFLSYDPRRNRFERHALEMPRHPETGTQGYFNYFTYEPDEQGWYYGYARNRMLFRLRPGGPNGPEAEALHATPGAVHQLSFCPAKRYLYYVPRLRDAMIVQQYDIKTGTVKTLGFLRRRIFERYGLSVGNGAYGAKVCGEGKYVVILDNGAFAGWGSAFGGHPVIVVVEIPEEERE